MGNVNAALTPSSSSFDATGKKYGCSAYNSSLEYGNWTIVNGANNNKGWTYFKMGGKSATLSTANPCYIYTNTEVAEQIESIAVHIVAGSLPESVMGVNSWGVYVYSDSDMKTQIDYVEGGDITKAEATFDFTPSAGKSWPKKSYFKVSWDLANTSTKNGIVWVDKITLLYTKVDDQVEKPTISPEATGTFFDAQNVTISTGTDGATIYYTTDGTTPTTSSSVYSAAIPVSSTTTIKAFAVKNGMTDSDVATATYTFGTVYSSLAELVAAGTPTSTGETVRVTLTNEVILGFYTDKSSKKNGVKIKSGTQEVEIFCYNVPDTWEVNGTISGTLTCPWKLYNSTWELCPSSWDDLTYNAPIGKENPTLSATWNNSLTVGGANDVYAVTYDGDGTLSVISSDPEVATVVINDANVTVTPVAAGTTIIEISAPETENYYSVSKSYTLTVSEPVQPAYLPFFFNGGVAKIAETDGMSHTGLGSDYSEKSNPRTQLKFDSTGDNLVISFSSAPTSLVFAIKGNSFSGGTFDVQASADGAAYTTLQSFTSIAAKDNIVGLPLSSDVRFVKFVYTQKSSGNVGLGYITVSSMNPATMVIDPANKWATFSTEFPVDIPANVYAYGISVEDDKAVRTKFGGDEAFAIGGKGAVLLYTDEEEGYSKTYYDGMSIINDPVDTYEGGNLLQPVFEPIAAGEFPTSAGYTKYILQNGAKGIGFYQVTSTNTLAANRAYLIVPDGTDVKGIFDITTGINEISEASVKAEGMYNMAGQKVGADYKGIVIVNGKKMLNK